MGGWVSHSGGNHRRDYGRVCLLSHRKVMTSDRHAEISTELSRLLAQQTEFFKKEAPTSAEIQEFKLAGERIRKLFAELAKAKAA
jgi:hypothetical protein